VSGAYDAWKAAKIGTELDILPGINEGIHTALTLAEAALREPAKRAVVEQWLETYAAHLEDRIDRHDDGLDLRDIGPALIDALAEFDEPFIRVDGAAVLDNVRTKALDALKAMESLNYTGDHTHFEVLADARQVLAAVMLGKTMPQLERFRCPSEFKTSKHVKVRCQLQLPHEGFHRFVQGGDGKGADWSDEASTNPPKSYDEPATAVPADRCRSIDPASGVLQCQYIPHLGQHRNENVIWASPSQICGATGMLGGNPAAVVCVRADEHKGVHCDAAGREWI
jgi:hypothetical protein